MTESEFKRALKAYPRLSDRAEDVARGVLVQGMTFDEVCTMYGPSRQLAHEWASKIYSQWKPPSWVTETITLPAADMATVKAMVTQARKALDASLPPVRSSRR
jgi:hypothetical protein